MAKSFILFICYAFCFAVSCKKKTTEQTRSFYMAVTPWPADFNQQEVDIAYNFINTNCDMASHHFDEGIPYEEAYNNSNWPAGLLADIQTRKTKTAGGKTIFLSSAAVNLTRKQKADYSRFSTGISSTVKNQWLALPVNDDKVVTAYTNYVIFLAAQLNAAFINYGVESNGDWTSSDFILYKDFLSKVYAKLKIAFPGKPIMISVMTSEVPANLNYASQLMPYTDYLALSSYPYTHVSSSANGNTNPALFPSSYFASYLNLAKEKPFGFAETAFIAEDLKVPAFSLNKTGTEQWQKDYLEMACKITNERKGKFLIWFCSKDYDAGNNTLRSLGLYQDLFALWEDTGFIDEDNRQRTSFVSWQNWMKRKKTD
jgi:hypothetical protein